MMNPENVALMPVTFQRDKHFVPIYFNEKISFQKPFEDREFITKVIETEVIAIKAKDQELSGGFLDIISLFLVLYFSLGIALSY